MMESKFEFLRGLAHCEDKEQMARYIQEHEQKPMTNADRIRAMTDEELADFMNCDGCPPKNEGCNEGQNCSLCWLNWLKQPCEAVQPITERPDGQS